MRTITHGARALFLTLTTACLLVTPALAQSSGEAREIFQDERVHVVLAAGVSITADAAQAIARRVEAAYDFAHASLTWTDEGRLLRPFTIELATQEDMRKRFPGASGATVSSSRFVLAESYLERARSADSTLAHELTHVQDRRKLGRRRAPLWLIEGRANAVGALYAASLGASSRTGRGEARALARLTGDDARAAFAGRVLPSGQQPKPAAPGADGTDAPASISMGALESTGHLFVEYLRARWRGGTPDALQRLSRVCERMGRGESIDDAFAAEMGGPLGEAQETFAAMLDETRASSPMRFRGTIWAPFYPREPTLY